MKAALVAVAASAVGGIAVGLPVTPSARYTAVDVVALLLIVGTWTACCGEPIVRFWSASRGRPPVQRSRLRALSVAYGSVVALLALVLSAGTQDPTPGKALAYQILSVALVPWLYAAFTPPAWLRRFWRQSEEEALRLSMQDLVPFTNEATTIAERGLEWATRLVGADAGAVVDADGTVLAKRGDIESLARDHAGRVEHNTIIVPLPTARGAGSIIVVSGPFTPLFGLDEVARLRDYATSLAMAVDRVHLVEALDAERSSYQNLLETVSDLGEGFLVVEKLKVVYANDAYCRLSGYSLDELKALPSIVDLATPAVQEMIADRIRRRALGETFPDHYELEMVRKDGRRIDVEVAQKFVTAPDGMRTISIIRDITERKRAEEELQRLDLSRRTFIVNAAHELRTPLAVVTGMASMLASHRDTMLPQQLDEGFNALARQVERVRALIDNLLDLTVLEQESTQLIDLQPVALAVAAKRALEAAPPPTGTSVEMQLAEDVEVLADPLRLDQVLVNMYTNAYRYGGPHVRLDAIETGDDLVLTIADDGPGVPADLVPHLFDPFTRGPDSRRMHGSGLGLVIVRRLMETFGGDVWYEPNLPHGARFSLRLKEVA
jgi:PAS domain S-box-containing protein